jgi:hypothetical protein
MAQLRLVSLDIIEFLLTRLTSWPVVVLVLVFVYRDLIDQAVKVMVMSKLNGGIADAIKGYDEIRARQAED